MNHTVAIDPKQIAKRKMKSLLFTAVIKLFAVISIIPLFMIMSHIFKEGITAIEPSFITSMPKPVGESGGGIANAIVGSIMIILLASIIALPTGILAGVYLADKGETKIGQFIRLSVEVLQGVPSIVIGLVVYLWVVKPTGSFSALSGGIALSIMMLPIVVRTTEETIRLIPKSLHEASLALGAPYYQTILKVVIPAGINGIVTGVLISIARIAGETAPLLFTAFGNPFMNLNPLKPIATLPHLIFTYAISPYEDWRKLAWGASIVLVVAILLLNTLSRVIASRSGMNR